MMWYRSGIYLGARRMAAIEVGADADEVENTKRRILEELSRGELIARGRHHVSTEFHGREGDFLNATIVSSELKPISILFWARLARKRRSENDAKYADWVNGVFFCPRGFYFDVEISDGEGVGAGRKPSYNWPEFHAVAMSYVAEEGGLHPGYRLADLERQMAAWTDGRWEKSPAPSMNRQHCQYAVAEYAATKQIRR